MKTVINDSDHFGKALRRARKSQRLTQQQLALTANTAPRFISELERGKPTCQAGKALHVARCLGLRVTVEDVEPLHQEDFCQALAVSSRIKYQSEGGPGLDACFELVRRVSARPAKDLVQLFHVVLFNYLIGNHDAHAKNHALLYAPFHEPEAVRLAPFYDLISTALYPALTKNMAMKIGASYDAENLGLRDWERYWKRIGFSLNQARRQSLEFMDLLTEQCASPGNEVESRIQSVIARRSTLLRKLLA